MLDIKFVIPADTIKEIHLSSRLLSLSWNSTAAYPGHTVSCRVLMSFVGYGAPITISFINDSGETLARKSGLVRHNTYTGSFTVPEDCEPGESIYFEVELPDNNLKGESEQIPLIPPIELMEMKWSAEKVRRDDTVSLSVKTRKCPDNTPAKIIIYEYNDEGYHEKVSEMLSTITDNKLDLDWRFKYPGDTTKIPTDAEMQKYGGTYSPLAYLFMVVINEIYYGDNGESGLLYFTDSIELELIDETGRPMAEAAYVLIPPDGSAAIEGRLNQNGFARLDDVPPGPYGLDFPDLEYELHSKLNSGTRIRSVAIKYFVLLDAGAWQADQEGNATTTFGLIAGGDIVLCNWLETFKGKLSDNTNPIIKNLLDYLQLEGPNRGYIVKQVHLKNPVHQDKRLLVLVPDLHLHYFRKEGWDNFITKKDSGEIVSLEDELVRFLTLTKDWADHNGVKVKFIQLGDCYELWESLAIFEAHISNEETKIKEFEIDYHSTTNQPRKEYLANKIDLSKKKISELKNKHDIYSNPDTLVKAIKDNYSKLFNCGVDITIIEGNHDNWLYNPIKEIECVIDKCIHMEHGHAVDPYNNDENWEKGYAVVRGLVIPSESIEPIRMGDCVKQMESVWDKFISFISGKPTREKMFIKYAFRQSLDNNKRVFVMGHTHHPKLIKKNLRQVNESLKEKKPHELSIGGMK